MNCNNGIVKVIKIYVLPTLKSLAISDSLRLARDSMIREKIIGGWDIRCNGNNGSITLNMHGGYLSWDISSLGSNSYAWKDSTGSAVSVNRNPQLVPAGKYNVTVTDIKGCISRDSITLHQPPKLLARIVIKDSANCSAPYVGKLYVTIKGGTYGYASDSHPAYRTRNMQWNTDL